MIKAEDIIGEVYGKLTITKFLGRKKSYIYCECKCDCGNITTGRYNNIKNRNKKSCGCLKRDSKTRSIINTTHGLSKTRFYDIWKGMKWRCSKSISPTSIHYESYASRGISVCERWKDFINFKDDMYDSYLKHAKEHGEENTSIDRIDVNKGYSPNNCRWATWEMQGNNRTNNHLINYKGKEYTTSELAKKHGLPPVLLISRLHRGWSIDRALNTPHVKIKRNEQQCWSL